MFSYDPFLVMLRSFAEDFEHACVGLFSGQCLFAATWRSLRGGFEKTDLSVRCDLKECVYPCIQVVVFDRMCVRALLKLPRHPKNIVITRTILE